MGETLVEETPKPEIPGLVFKEMERRPSKKKRRSRPSSSFIESELNLVEDVSSETAKHLESKIFEIMTTDREEKKTPVNENNKVDSHKTNENQQCNNKSKENTLKRKNSK